MTYLLIDVPIKLTNEAEPNTLCLTTTPAPHIFVAFSRFLLVVSLGKQTDIPHLDEVWDVSIGWHFKKDEFWDEELHTPYVLPKNVGKGHTKITFRQQIATDAPKGATHLGDIKLSRLSDMMHSAPRFDRSGGYRGGNNSYERGVRQGILWLTKEAAEALGKKLGTPVRLRREKMKYLSGLIMKDQARNETTHESENDQAEQQGRDDSRQARWG